MKIKPIVQLVAAIGAALLLYWLSYAPVMAFIFWGFNAGAISEAKLKKADALYAPVIRFGPYPELFSPYEGFWREAALKYFR